MTDAAEVEPTSDESFREVFVGLPVYTSNERGAPQLGFASMRAMLWTKKDGTQSVFIEGVNQAASFLSSPRKP
jgi:hypothetical protein